MSNGWSLETYLGQRVAQVESALDRFLPKTAERPERLHEAMRYSVFAGGKRLRPILLLAACETVGGTPEHALPAACAIEMIHSYSLIHDDLPAMDDDDMRRGRPTNHKIFGEATAILAGDALLTDAFALCSTAAGQGTVSFEACLEVQRLLAESAGSRGMVGGQLVDMESEHQSVDLATLEFIHSRKTGALILAAVEIGAVLGGADHAQRRALRAYGQAAGMAFQIADDILDVVAEPAQLGKSTGSDEQRGKATYPGLLGLDRARERARLLRRQAGEALSGFGEAARPLQEIADYIVDRSC